MAHPVCHDHYTKQHDNKIQGVIMLRIKTIAMTSLIVATVALVGCNKTQEYTAGGAALGAGAGAIIGAGSGHAGTGAAIGAIVGGATGAAVSE